MSSLTPTLPSLPPDGHIWVTLHPSQGIQDGFYLEIPILRLNENSTPGSRVKYLQYVAWTILALDGSIILDGQTITDPHELKDKHIYVFDYASPLCKPPECWISAKNSSWWMMNFTQPEGEIFQQRVERMLKVVEIPVTKIAIELFQHTFNTISGDENLLENQGLWLYIANLSIKQCVFIERSSTSIYTGFSIPLPRPEA
jgi:hypothetical protein